MSSLRQAGRWGSRPNSGLSGPERSRFGDWGTSWGPSGWAGPTAKEATVKQDSKASQLQPPLPKQQQADPGVTSEMSPRPDHGEESYKGNGKLQGRAAIITGGDSGIGRAVAIAFAREGADVLISYLKEDEDAEETRRWIVEAGRRAILMRGDIGDENHCEEIVARAREEFG